MPKITLGSLSNLANEASAVGTINSNMQTIVSAFDNTVSRDGTVPNQMDADFDMNENRILNLPEPEDGAEPLRLMDADMVLDSLDDINQAVIDSAASAAAAALSAAAAQLAETNAETAEVNAELAETNAEAAQVAAEAARDAAQTAETNAELAETNAELAETNAETAEVNAEAAQAAAEAARDAAIAARDAALVAETNAELAEANAETAEVNAELAETNAETAQAAAEAARDLALVYRDEAEDFADSVDPDFLLDRTNHTGTQTLSTISDAGTAAAEDIGFFATAAQGTLAGTALQPAAIGVSVQAYDAQLDDIAGLTPTDSNFIVGNGTDFVTESGATVRTSMGVGTGDTPQFTGIELSHATANTLTGSGGDAFIEGNRLFRVGGTDVPVADGGTGSGTASGARANLGAAGTSQTGQISFYVPTVANETIYVVLKSAFAFTVTDIATDATSGTCTLTGQIDGTPLGGTANSVSTTETNQAHASANAVAVGNDLTCVITSNSSCLGMRVRIQYTYTLA